MAVGSVLYDRRLERVRRIPGWIVLVHAVLFYVAATATLLALGGAMLRLAAGGVLAVVGTSILLVAPGVVVFSAVAVFAWLALHVRPTIPLLGSSRGVSLSQNSWVLPWSAIRQLTFSWSLHGQPTLEVIIPAPHAELALRVVPARWVHRLLRDPDRDPMDVVRDALGPRPLEERAPDPIDLARLELWLFHASAAQAAVVGAVALIVSSACVGPLVYRLDGAVFVPSLIAGVLASCVLVAALLFVSRSTALASGTEWRGVSAEQNGRLDEELPRPRLESSVLRPILPRGAHLVRAPASRPTRAVALDATYRTVGGTAPHGVERAGWRPRLLITSETLRNLSAPRDLL